MKDGIYRARLRGASTLIRGQVEAITSGLIKRDLGDEYGTT
jgi:hypothetical protein